MATTTVNSGQDVVSRDILLTGEFTRHLLQHPQLLETLPERFELVLLPDDDPELQAHNLLLLHQRQDQLEDPVVLVWVRNKANGSHGSQPLFQIFAPVGVVDLARKFNPAA
jgi:hypothetical protein